MQANRLSRKRALHMLGHPGKERIPHKYLKTLPLYRELVFEQAWGPDIYNADGYFKLRVELENIKNER